MDNEEFNATFMKAFKEVMGAEVRVVSLSEFERLIASDDEAEPSEFQRRQTKALVGIRRQQAELLKQYDVLRSLEKSIATPENERTNKHMLDEILLALQLRVA